MPTCAAARRDRDAPHLLHVIREVLDLFRPVHRRGLDGVLDRIERMS